MKQGKLFRAGVNQRWNIVYAVQPEIIHDTLTSGSVIEIKIDGKWIKTTIEHNGKDYYSVSAVNLVNGLIVRIPSGGIA